MRLSLATCAEWMGGALVTGPVPNPEAPGPSLEVPGGGVPLVAGYSIDSRTVAPGELFFAVSGERFDAHRFVAAACERGAITSVVARDKVAEFGLESRVRIEVDDPLLALQRLGAAARRHWGGTVVGLTGSAGKTTTKEMVAAVLSAKYPTLKSAGNLNNHFGVPLQLLRLEPEHQYAVIEMGMSATGEIAQLASLARPDWAVVTNVGMAHAGNFTDGIEGVAAAKRELVEALALDGLAFLNSDDPRVAGFAHGFAGRSVLAGCSANAAVRATAVEDLGAEGTRMRVTAPGQAEAEIRLRLLGAHNANNALLALAVGVEAGVLLTEGGAGLEALTPGDKRGEILEVHGARIINDCYNSNPAALRAMIAALMRLPARRHIVIAGEMLELGPETGALHAALGGEAARAGADWVIGVQGAALALAEEAARAGTMALFFQTAEEAGVWLQREMREGDAVLLKGSRGVRLERALEGVLL